MIMEDKYNILVVDDTPSTLLLHSKIISSDKQYIVFRAVDGVQAMDIIRQERIDILVTDYMMPVIDGVELTILAMAHEPTIRAILVTGIEDKEIVVQALKAGMVDYISKPVTPRELLFSVQRVAYQVKNDRKIKKQQQHISLYFAALQQSSASIMITDANGDVEYVNPYFTKISGYSEEEVVGKNPRMFRANDDSPLGFRLWDYVRNKGEWRGEFENVKKHGAIYWENVMISAVKNEQGEVTNFVIIKDDITEKKQMAEDLKNYSNNLQQLVDERTLNLAEANKKLKEEMLERINVEKLRQEQEINAMNQNKYASLGEIATGVAHEINQPLTYINTVLQVGLEKFQQGTIDPEKFTKKFERAIHQTGRITSIITHLRAFGRVDDDLMIPVALAEILENSLILLQEKIRLSNIILHQEVAENLPDIIGNSNKLEQLFINFFQNSIDALEEKGGGNITVSLQYSQENGEVIVSFGDDGSGIPLKIQEKIYQPFITTKEIGKGTGLGLSIVFGIVQEHKGTISLCSEEGVGTTFVITFPVLAE